MSLTWNDLTISFEHLDRAKLMEDWKWLVGSALAILADLRRRCIPAKRIW